MKRFKMIVRLIYGLELLFSIVVYMLSPSKVILHFSGQGTPDYYGNKVGIFLQAFLLIFIGELLIVIAKRKRKMAGLESLPSLLFNEWGYVSVVVVVFVIFSYIILLQTHKGA